MTDSYNRIQLHINDFKRCYFKFLHCCVIFTDGIFSCMCAIDLKYIYDKMCLNAFKCQNVHYGRKSLFVATAEQHSLN